MTQTASIKVRARAVDMLGRQQIAGIPTALHELFKNAYDAFATRVEVDLLVQRHTLILRDDGFGMTEADFLERWLTLGTESKLGWAEHTAPWLGDYGNVPRRMLGEKGIGRLAIAAIGPAVLVLTRAKREEGLHDLVVSLIHWALFEVPGLDLDRIRIPVISLSGGKLPRQNDVEQLVKTLLREITALGDVIPADIRSRISTDLNQMTFSPKDVLDALDKGRLEDESGLSLEGAGHGTQFVIRPYDPVLDADLAEETESEASALERFLIGFGNTMFPEFPPPPIKAAFRQHRLDGEIRDFIGERAFFTPEESLTADQIIQGHFDEYGQFMGTVKIFDRPPVPYTLNWSGAKGNPALCGPFDIRFGYVQGLAHQSLLPKEQWTVMDMKLNRIGGLYIYRDGVRILPYGNHDYDFLNIEKRRTLAAKDWYFSYRRIFGAILVSAATNSALQEKAGREGFRENVAYRQFKDVLENLFKSLATDFFRKDAPLGEEFNRMKADMDVRRDVLEKREKLVKVRKERFKADLDGFFQRVESGEPSAESERIKIGLDARFDTVAGLDDPDAMGEQLHGLEGEIRGSIDSFRQRYRVRRPQGIGLTKQMTSDWQAYRRTYAELEQGCMAPLASHFDGRLAELLERRGVALNRQRLLQEALESREQTIRKNAQRGEREARDGLTRARDSITKGITSSIHRLHNDISAVLSDLERTNVMALDGEAVVELRGVLERRLDTAAEREIRFLEKLREQMDDLSEAISAGVLPDDVTSALEDSNRELNEELEDSLHWAQVGMALGIVQHEFNGVVRKIKKGINELRPWAKGTPELSELFGDLRSGFSHLEEYLRLFAPLDRRLYRQRTPLSGEEIRGYLLHVFGDRFERHGIDFDPTDRFRKSMVTVFPSTLLPVFLNIVDNACYWLTQEPRQSRRISIDLHPSGIVVENNGPGIEQRLVDRIFDFGFTTKTSGRGMGLSIARRALRHEGMDLLLLDSGKTKPVRFLIVIPQGEKTE
jgi:signal transduction histidine kinase